jgi:3-deoxy-D-manno-octulosonic-acid transferase
MRVLYNLIILLYEKVIRLAAITGHSKARQWVNGRKEWKEKLAGINADKKKLYWIHCASLGEFEQGRPLIEAIKNDHDCFVLLTFYSPSGFEPAKNFSRADRVIYLPSDSPANAKDFIEFVNPSAVFFIKYEFWYNYISQLSERRIPLYMVSSIFRKSQPFFKWYGKFFRQMLAGVKHFFVQDANSVMLLNNAGFKNVTISGDTRFDRVKEISTNAGKLEIIEQFKGSSPIIIGGSTWEKDEEYLLENFKSIENLNCKLILAPHDTDESRIASLENKIKKLFGENAHERYSSFSVSAKTILIIDTIGLLSRAYRYSSIAWIGGGFGKGIHNILEAAAFGNAVIFGPNHEKAKEAKEMIGNGSAFAIKSSSESIAIIEKLLSDTEYLQQCHDAALFYISSNTGATLRILSELEKSM